MNIAFIPFFHLPRQLQGLYKYLYLVLLLTTNVFSMTCWYFSFFLSILPEINYINKKAEILENRSDWAGYSVEANCCLVHSRRAI